MTNTIKYAGLDILVEQPTEASPYVVEDYPYGFRQRTTIRYYIDTTKNGQRFVSQTMNPKTGVWNKPKKSTYNRITLIGLEPETGYVRSCGISGHSPDFDRKTIAALESIFSKFQQSEAKAIVAIHKVIDNVTCTIRTQQFRHKVTGEIVEQVPLMQLNQYEQITQDEEDRTQDKIRSHLCHAIVSEMEQSGLKHECAVERLRG